jgi:predicted alpha/beta-fold hydrolase
LAGDALNSVDDAGVDSADTFRPPRLLRSSHLQSILGSVPPRAWLIRRRAAALLAASKTMVLDCGEGVRLLGFHTPQGPDRRSTDGRRLAVLLHGWEGSSESPYVLSAAALLFQRGFGVVRLNLRDHGATHALNRELFHSCRLPEIVGAVRALSTQFPAARLYLGGFSLGGNFMLRVAADAGAPDVIAGVVAVSPVIDPEATLRALEQGLAVYRRYFVRRWSRSLRAKQRAWPGVHDFDELARSADLRRMTSDLVQRSTDFGSLEAYLEGYAVTGKRLASLRVPARVLVAADDPIIPAADIRRLAPSERLTIVRTRYGGHCGFIEDWGRPSYADRFMLEQFQQFERPGSPQTSGRNGS